MKDTNTALAEKIGMDFARERRRSMDDPIVKELIRGCKMSLGASAYRNKRQAEAAALQPCLEFGGKPAKPVLEFKRKERED